MGQPALLGPPRRDGSTLRRGRATAAATLVVTATAKATGTSHKAVKAQPTAHAIPIRNLHPTAIMMVRAWMATPLAPLGLVQRLVVATPCLSLSP